MAMPITVPRYTIADLAHFPDDGNRYELLDGVLLVTPQAAAPHQIIAGRLQHLLAGAVADPGLAHVVGPGEVELQPATHLEPDLLVYPASYPPDTAWSEIQDWWLAVEVLSPSSKVYDRDFKRGAYLSLGVREVWIVDRDRHAIEVTTRAGTTKVTGEMMWRPPAGGPVTIDLSAVFAGL